MLPPHRSNHPLASLAVCALMGALTACSGADEKSGDDSVGPAAERASCDPTAPELCGTPFPSTFYMKEDSSTVTGWRIDMADDTLPTNIDNFQPLPTYWNQKDGWAVTTPMLALIPDVAVTNLPGHDSIDASLGADSPIVVIDADTGARIPVWAEKDVSLGESDRSLLMLHAAAPFEYGHRYVVGIRDLSDISGSPIAPSDAMAALNEGKTTGDPEVDGQLERRRSVYEDTIFPALEDQGWSRSEIVLAWDFVTASQENTTGRALYMRDQAEAWIPADGPEYVINEIVEAPNESTAWRVEGEVTVPLFTLEDGPGTVLTRDDANLPFINGKTTAGFTAIVPNSVVDAGVPVPIVQYGHGLLGGRGEVQAGYLAEMADRYGWIIFAMDWTGMKSSDAGYISLMLVEDLGDFAIVPERSLQGFTEFHVGLKLFQGPLVNDEHFTVADATTGERMPLLDPERVYYYGNSQGGILGGAYSAISNEIERAVLGVGGGPYHLLLTRSKDFDPFFTLFESMYPDPAEVGLWLGLLQTLWDEAEGAGYARAFSTDPIPGNPEKHVLQQVAIGDNQVTTLGAQFLARGHGAVLIDNAARAVWDIEKVSGATTENVLVEYEYGIDEPYVNLPPSDPDPHEWPRRERSGQDQIAHFFETGETQSFCEGVCGDPTRGQE